VDSRTGERSVTKPVVSIITPTTGNPLLADALASVRKQTYQPIQHVVFLEGQQAAERARLLLAGYDVDLVALPYATGANGFNGHRVYGASAYLAKGDYLCFLDEDNWFDPDHVEALVETVRKGNHWAFSLRKIVDRDGQFICRDDCESLGKWPSVLDPNDYFVDVGCFFLPRGLALQVSPLWYRRFRQPGVMEVDRAITAPLRSAPNLKFDTSGRYSLNYRAGSTANSVKPEFFLRGNEAMKQRFGGKLPWRGTTTRKSTAS
jgi:glycosyltransferase involved in cell wall biosynthesis